MVSTEPLLRTKLFIPRVRPEWIARARLTEQLDSITHRPLTLISAPAGFGKTTVLAEWLWMKAKSAVWLSLDDGDNEPARFWWYVIAALQTIGAELGASAISLLQSAAPPPMQSILTILLNDLTELREPIILVLDDYHLIETGTIHDELTFLLTHLPPQLHLIITSRSDPLLPLARLRAQGQLSELRADDLRFTTSEAAEFLNQAMGLNLTADDVASLEQRTEGWIVGLQLAAISLQGRTDQTAFLAAFSGSNRFILDYLTSEVLNRLAPHLYDFVLRTSILDRLCGDLCDTLLDIADPNQRSTGDPTAGRAYSQLLLQELEQANLFLIPLDDQRVWYRYHHLFAEVIQNRLRQGTTATALAELYRRAARWCERQGLLDEALRYAQTIPDEELTADILERHTMPILFRSEVLTVQRWLALLPQSFIMSRTRLLLTACWTALLRDDLDQTEALLTRGADLLDPGRLSATLNGELLLLRISLARFRGQLAETLALSEALTPYLSDAPLWWQAGVTLNLGYIHLLHNNIEAATAALEETSAFTDPSTIYLALMALSVLGSVYLRQGRLGQAMTAANRAQQLVKNWSGPVPSVAALAAVTIGEVLLERNDLDEAERILEAGFRQLVGTVEHLPIIRGYVVLARIRVVRGDRAGAFALLEQGQQLLQERQVLTHHAWHWTVAAQCRLLIRAGRLDEAAAKAEPATSPGETATYQQLTLARLMLARYAQNRDRESLDQVDRLLAEALERAETSGWTRDMIECLIIRCRVHDLAGDHKAAANDLSRALSLAALEGSLRLFLDEGEAIARLLQYLTPQNVPIDYLDRLRRAFDLEIESGQAPELTTPQPNDLSRVAQSPALVEQISQREHDVLNLIAIGASNREIADQLVIALPTVKKHISNILGKLNVTNRTQAIARARELGLL